MAKTGVITEEQWVKIKTYFELGRSANWIGREFGTTHTTITRKAKKEGWVHKAIEAQVSVIKENITAVSNMCTEKQIPLITEILKGEIDDTFNIASELKSLDQMALRLQNTIMKNTIKKLDKMDMGELEATNIVKGLGLAADKVADRAGLGKKPDGDTNIQVNDSNVVFEIQPIGIKE